MSVPLDRGDSLARVAGVVHGFTGRPGGISIGALASLNLGRDRGEPVETTDENWRRAIHALAPGLGIDRLATLTQVHGANVVRVSAPAGTATAVAEADAAFTTEADLVLAVRTADCVPVLVAGPGVVGVAHSGWRGTAAGVVNALIRAMVDATGVPPADLAATIGPAIGGGAYQVGSEVIAGLKAAGLTPRQFRTPAHLDHVDLQNAVFAQLTAAGLLRVDRIRRCTATDPQLFSHRRDGPRTGRQAGLIARCV